MKNVNRDKLRKENEEEVNLPGRVIHRVYFQLPWYFSLYVKSILKNVHWLLLLPGWLIEMLKNNEYSEGLKDEKISKIVSWLLRTYNWVDIWMNGFKIWRKLAQTLFLSFVSSHAVGIEVILN